MRYNSCIFHPSYLLPHFPLLQFPLLHFQRPQVTFSAPMVYYLIDLYRIGT